MDILSILLIVYLAYTNGIKAKKIGRNALLWGGLTVVSYFIGGIIGFCIIIGTFYHAPVNYDQVAIDKKYADQVTQQIVDFIAQNPLHSCLLVSFCFGGFFLIRFILDKMKLPPANKYRRIEPGSDTNQ